MNLPSVGVGVDVHKFSKSSQQPLSLAGLLWEGFPALLGHSDGDVVCHAAADALFSAAGLGDLGTHFGVDQVKFLGIKGAFLLGEAGRIVREAGFEIGNVAVQIVGNKPNFSSRREEAETVLSQALLAKVCLSATTTDGLGFTGRGEGVAAIANALVLRSLVV